MAQVITLAAEPRTQTGKGPARQARFQKKIPGVVYGRSLAPTSFHLRCRSFALRASVFVTFEGPQ